MLECWENAGKSNRLRGMVNVKPGRDDASLCSAYGRSGKEYKER